MVNGKWREFMSAMHSAVKFDPKTFTNLPMASKMVEQLYSANVASKKLLNNAGLTQ